MYSTVRNILFLFPAESVHYFSMNALKLACKSKFTRQYLYSKFSIPDPKLERHLWGLHFKNPVGLAAGFDKNAKYLTEIETLGFGFVEIGTVTPLPQPGNEKPRLFRLRKDKALINRMGFNNDGVKIISNRLRKWKDSHPRQSINPGNKYKRLIIGGNIGKNKSTPNESAWKDYELCFRELVDCVDYFVVNVSSPNTPGLRELQEKESLRKILSNLQIINNQQPIPRPILLKIAPDLNVSQLDDVIAIGFEIHLNGFVATNTTIAREGLSNASKTIADKIANGGLSGKPLAQKSTDIVRYIHQKTGDAIPIIASGGIFDTEEAKRKLSAGASLLQVWTGFIYEGPSIVKNICNNLFPKQILTN